MADDVIECATHGDAILVVGTELLVRKIKVDTHVLKAVSKTFRAMFGHQWSDGQNLSYIAPKKISFPDDSPEAMEIVCRILHHRYYADASSLNAVRLLSLARLVDKYSLLEAMAFTGDCLLRTNTTDDPQTLMYLLEAAFLFQNAELKEKLFRKLICRHASDYALLMSSDTLQELIDLKGSMSMTRQKLHDQFHSLLLSVFTYIPRVHRGPCDCLYAYNKSLYSYIIKHNLLPDEHDLNPKSIYERVQLMQELPEPFRDQFAHSGAGGFHKPKSVSPPDMYADMRSTLDKLLTSMDSVKLM